MWIGALSSPPFSSYPHPTTASSPVNAKPQALPSSEHKTLTMLTPPSQIVTNHLLHFLALDRSDPKKFQILQLIGSLLGWTDEQREQAGLSRPATTTATITSTPSSITGVGSLRLPKSLPLVHRTPSTPALTANYFPDAAAGVGSPASKESLAELWQSFLEQESGAAAGASAKEKG